MSQAKKLLEQAAGLEETAMKDGYYGTPQKELAARKANIDKHLKKVQDYIKAMYSAVEKAQGKDPKSWYGTGDLASMESRLEDIASNCNQGIWK